MQTNKAPQILNGSFKVFYKIVPSWSVRLPATAANMQFQQRHLMHMLFLINQCCDSSLMNKRCFSWLEYVYL